MARPRRLPFPAAGWVSLVLAFAGCGGSGSGGGSAAFGVEHWNGHHHLVSIEGPGTGLVTDTVVTRWGVAALDGAGSLEATGMRNADGSVSPSLSIPGLDRTYTVAPDREIVVETLGSPFLRGGISLGGDIAIASPVAADAGPALHVFGRRAGAFGLFPLSGTWRLAALSYVAGASVQGAFFGTVTLDDAGDGTLTAATNSEGTIIASSSAPVTYLVFADGSMRLAVPGGIALEGGLVRSGNVILLAGGTSDPENPTLFLLVREAASPSLSSLQGEWFLAGWQFDVSAGTFAGVEGRAVADAAGTLTADLVRNAAGTYTDLPPQSATLSLGAGGTLTLTLGGSGDVLVGGLSPEHDFAILAGGTNAGSSPSLFLLLR
jgi:hypothetical protein